MASEKDNSRGVLFSDRDNPAAAAILPVLSATLGRFGRGWWGGGWAEDPCGASPWPSSLISPLLYLHLTTHTTHHYLLLLVEVVVVEVEVVVVTSSSTSSSSSRSFSGGPTGKQSPSPRSTIKDKKKEYITTQ